MNKIFPETRVGDICDVIAGQSPTSDTYNQNGEGLPFYQGKADFGDLFPKTRYWCNRPLKIALPKDILLSVRAPVGPTNICETKSCIGRGLSAIRCKTDADYKYVLHYFRKIEQKLGDQGRGSTFSAITQDEIKNIQIPFPPLPEQRRIAAILDKADELRKKRAESIRLADEFLKSVFLEMFGDPLSNPKNWPIKRLEEVCTKITDGVHLKPNYSDTGIPFISVKDITSGKLLFDNCKYISEEDHKINTKRVKAEYLDVLYTKVGATYGRAAIVDTMKEFSLYVSVALLKPNRELIDPHFLKETMANPAIKHQADKAIKGIGVPDLHLTEIKKFLIPVPPMKVQSEFLDIVNVAHKIAEKNNSALTHFDAMFNSLLQRAFHGAL